jgi:hypothetical protein
MLIRPKGGRDENIQSSKCPGSRIDFCGVHLSRVPPIQAGTKIRAYELRNPVLYALATDKVVVQLGLRFSDYIIPANELRLLGQTGAASTAA